MQTHDCILFIRAPRGCALGYAEIADALSRTLGTENLVVDPSDDAGRKTRTRIYAHIPSNVLATTEWLGNQFPALRECAEILASRIGRSVGFRILWQPEGLKSRAQLTRIVPLQAGQGAG